MAFVPPEVDPEVQTQLGMPVIPSADTLFEPSQALVDVLGEDQEPAAAAEQVLPPQLDEGVVAGAVPPQGTRTNRTAPTRKPAKKGGGAGAGFAEATFSPPPDPEVLALQALSMAKLADIQQLDHEARAVSMGVQAGVYDRLTNQLLEDYEGTKQKVEGLLGEAEVELAAVDELIEAARSNRINPGQFFANVGDAGKFASAIAVGAGAMATAFGGGPNVAYQIISSAIDRNVRAQIVNQQHDRAMVSHQLNFVHAIRGLSGDHANLGNITRAALTAMAQARIAEATAAYGSQHFALAAAAVLPQFGADLAEAQIKANEHVKFKARLKINNLHKADLVMDKIRQLAAPQQPPQQAARQLPPPRQARPPSAGVGGPPREPAPTTGVEAPAEVDLDQPMTILNVPEVQASQTPQEMAKNIALEFKRTRGRQARRGETGGPVTQQDINAFVEQFRNDDRDSEAGQLYEALINTEDRFFQPTDERQRLVWSSPTRGTVSMELRDPTEYNELKPNERDKFKGEIIQKSEARHTIRELQTLIGRMSQGEGILGDLIRAGAEGERLLLPIFGTADERGLQKKLVVLKKGLANAKRLAKGSDAIRSVTEWKLWETLTTGDISIRDQLVDFLRSNPEARQAVLQPYVEQADEEFDIAAGKHLILEEE